MKILVTVGSGCFNQLIEAVDRQLNNPSYEVLCQVASGGYQPKNHRFYEFKDDFKSDLLAADLVITHGGGATVFELLECRKKTVVVPNLFRVDSHQLDLAEYIEREKLAVVCRDLSNLASAVEQCIVAELETYQKEPFFMGNSVLQFFGLKD